MARARLRDPAAPLPFGCTSASGGGGGTSVRWAAGRGARGGRPGRRPAGSRGRTARAGGGEERRRGTCSSVLGLSRRKWPRTRRAGNPRACGQAAAGAAGFGPGPLCGGCGRPPSVGNRGPSREGRRRGWGRGPAPGSAEPDGPVPRSPRSARGGSAADFSAQSSRARPARSRLPHHLPDPSRCPRAPRTRRRASPAARTLFASLTLGLDGAGAAGSRCLGASRPVNRASAVPSPEVRLRPPPLGGHSVGLQAAPRVHGHDLLVEGGSCSRPVCTWVGTARFCSWEAGGRGSWSARMREGRQVCRGSPRSSGRNRERGIHRTCGHMIVHRATETTPGQRSVFSTNGETGNRDIHMDE
ncbi:translation initiation factor IF-2-like [Lutra lutra]|uniref:translation initiation factor IF-2-like n=1 Tax=Lutra lutra TaxID=9657 RepID=UPI001FD2E4DB|nr:translation initiation factor IF-2-like [Lutra lutra]